MDQSVWRERTRCVLGTARGSGVLDEERKVPRGSGSDAGFSSLRAVSTESVDPSGLETPMTGLFPFGSSPDAATSSSMDTTSPSRNGRSMASDSRSGTDAIPARGFGVVAPLPTVERASAAPTRHAATECSVRLAGVRSRPRPVDHLRTSEATQTVIQTHTNQAIMRAHPPTQRTTDPESSAWDAETEPVIAATPAWENGTPPISIRPIGTATTSTARAATEDTPLISHQRLGGGATMALVTAHPSSLPGRRRPRPLPTRGGT
jgi:hypothetical protein